MKRKIFMMGFAMMAGLPHAVCAKGGGKENLAQSYSSWNGSYMPHYGSEGAARPLMDHLSVSSVSYRDDDRNKWRLAFSMPRAEVAGASDSPVERGTRMGVSLKLDF